MTESGWDRRKTPRVSPEQRGYNSTWRKLRLAILQRDNWTCAYCGIYMKGVKGLASVDHVLPVDTHPHLMYVASNLLSACMPCNRSRGAKQGARKRNGTFAPKPLPPRPRKPRIW